MTVRADDFGSWTHSERFIFRVACLFFTMMSIPLSWGYYKHLFSLDLLNVNYRDITNLGRFSPNLISIATESGRWGILSYVDWFLILGIAVTGAIFWSFFDKRKSYNQLYYWVRTIVRYRIAIGMIEFGFVKVFLIQMPFPPIATLNTNFGDFTAQKLYWLSVGIVPEYQVYLGLLEVAAGFLLFFRKTTFIGAFLTLCASANIVYINHAYDGGVHVYSAYFVLLSLFLLWRDIPRIVQLLIYERGVNPVNYYPNFSKIKEKSLRYLAKSLFIFVFVVMLPTLHWKNFKSVNRNMKLPIESGISGAAGYYEVKEFKRNGVPIPYSPFDTVRWQDAIFETYSTLSFKVNQPVQINFSNGVPRDRGLFSEWEFSGRAGGRRFFYYDIDSVNQVIMLQDKQRERGGSRVQRDKEEEKYLMYYKQDDSGDLVLSGSMDDLDSLYIRLNRIEKRYPLFERDNY